MPELSNIQTYTELKNKDYIPTIAKFKRVLLNLDAWDEPTERAFENPNWRDDGGFIYSELMNLEPRTTKLSGVRIRPLLQVWTPTIDASLKSNWVSCDLLIETEELTEQGQFLEYTFPFVEKLVSEMVGNFGTPTYFTDETDDGEPLDGLRTNDPNKLWKFDYALIPLELSNFYSTPPSTHQFRTKGQLLECWKTERWGPKNTDNRR